MKNKHVKSDCRGIPFITHRFRQRGIYACLCAAMCILPASEAFAQSSGNNRQTPKEKVTGKTTYKGVVIDDTDMPLPGVNITYRNAKGAGAITDVNGEFTITVPDGARQRA